jgi:hypothetical protein
MNKPDWCAAYSIGCIAEYIFPAPNVYALGFQTLGFVICLLAIHGIQEWLKGSNYRRNGETQ